MTRSRDVANIDGILTAKGDIYAATAAATPDRLGVGANNTVLTADSATATGLKWAAPAASSGPAIRVWRVTSNQSITANTYTKVQFNAEQYDTDNCFDSTTNYRFTPNKAGYYLCTASLLFQGTTGWLENQIYFNGTKIANGGGQIPSQGYTTWPNTVILYFNGTTDYLEVFATAQFNVTINSSSPGGDSHLDCIWIRS
jgi:hypothetical protein